MNRKLTASILLLVGLMTTAFGQAPQIQPDGPIIWQASFEDTFVTNFCGFPMEVYGSGTGVFHLFLDDYGNFERIIINGPETFYIFTNLDTGESVRSPSVNMVMETMNEDGTGTKTLRGLLWHLIVPGEGLITADTGRIDWLFTFDDQGNIISEEIVFSAGIQEGVFIPTLCSVLGS